MAHQAQHDSAGSCGDLQFRSSLSVSAQEKQHLSIICWLGPDLSIIPSISDPSRTQTSPLRHHAVRPLLTSSRTEIVQGSFLGSGIIVLSAALSACFRLTVGTKMCYKKKKSLIAIYKDQQSQKGRSSSEKTHKLLQTFYSTNKADNNTSMILYEIQH